MDSHDKTSSSDAQTEQAPAYEAPRLVLVGNLRELLAGGGSKPKSDTPRAATKNG